MMDRKYKRKKIQTGFTSSSTGNIKKSNPETEQLM